MCISWLRPWSWIWCCIGLSVGINYKMAKGLAEDCNKNVGSCEVSDPLKSNIWKYFCKTCQEKQLKNLWHHHNASAMNSVGHHGWASRRNSHWTEQMPSLQLAASMVWPQTQKARVKKKNGWFISIMLRPLVFQNALESRVPRWTGVGLACGKKQSIIKMSFG